MLTIKSNNSNLLVRFVSQWNNSNWNWIDDFIDNSVRRKKKRRERNEIFIKFVLFFSFCFSDLYTNNLNGTIPTEIGFMTSLTILWEEKRNELVIKIWLILFLFFHFVFHFHFRDLDLNKLTGTIPTQIGLMTSLQYLWEGKKRRERNEPFIKICFILLSFNIYFCLDVWTIINSLERFPLN